MNWIEYDKSTGAVCGTGSGEQMPVDTDRRGFVDVSQRSDVDAVYDAKTNTFRSATPRTRTRLSKADVIGLLTPAEWAQMNRYAPGAVAPYDDAEVFWAVSLFKEAEYIDLADPRVSAILSSLVAKGLLTTQRLQTLTAAMQEAAK